MARRLSRFRYLEWARAPKAHDTHPPRADTERFEALEPDAAPPSELRSAQGHLARFDETAEDELLLHEPSEADQPFVRCALCEADNGRFAVSCVACGAAFDSPDQRAFNEQLWAKRRAQREEEHAQHRILERAHLDDGAELSTERRRYHEELARRVGRETRERLGGDPWGRLAGWLGRGEDVRRTRMNLGIGAVLIGILFVAASATGGPRAVARVLVMLAIVGAVIGVRWFLRRGR
jgi:hypothetical protein